MNGRVSNVVTIGQQKLIVLHHPINVKVLVYVTHLVQMGLIVVLRFAGKKGSAKPNLIHVRRMDTLAG